MTCCTCGQLCFLTPSSTMDLLVVEKGVPSCKCRWTHITRKLLRHLQYSDLLSSCDLFRLLKIIETLNFPFQPRTISLNALIPPTPQHPPPPILKQTLGQQFHPRILERCFNEGRDVRVWLHIALYIWPVWGRGVILDPTIRKALCAP